MKHEKRGISAVVATVLLILITIAAIILIAGFLIPWVKTSLPKVNCVDVLGMVKIVEDKTYTCSGSPTKVMIEIGYADIEVDALVIVLSGEGKSKRFEIINGTKTEDLPGVDSGDGDLYIEVPEQGETRTYTFNIAETEIDFPVEKAEAALIVGKDKICESVEMSLPAC